MPYIASSWPTSLLSRVRRKPSIGPSSTLRAVRIFPTGALFAWAFMYSSRVMVFSSSSSSSTGGGALFSPSDAGVPSGHLQEHHLSCHPSCTIHGLRVQNPSHGQCHCGDRIHDDHPFLSCVLLCHLHVVHLCHLCGPRLEQAFRACQCHRRDGHHDACRPSHVPDDRFSACEPHAWALPLSLLQPSQGA